MPISIQENSVVNINRVIKFLIRVFIQQLIKMKILFLKLLEKVFLQ